MELRTVMLMLAIGSFLFAILLIIFKFRKEAPQEVPYWIVAKFLQGVGSLILYFKTTTYDVITMTANLILLLGCAYEVWVIRILSGHTVKRWVHLVTSALIALVCTSTLFLSSTVRTGIIFFLQSILYILPAVFLFMKSDFKSYLKSLLRICYLITGVIFLTTSIIAFAFPSFIDSEAGRMFLGVIPATSFCIFLISGFILLMLAKERTDTLVKAMEKSLKESEIRFQRIVETSIEGILIFDENYKITFVNKNMASMLGYNTKELLGKSYISLFPEDKLDIYYRQEKLRKTGEHSVYECCLIRSDGKRHWFLVSATALFDEYNRFEGSFAMLTDINDRKEMEMLLEDLSNKDGLTGIANRRKFDETLNNDYIRLQQTNAKLSVLLIDIDYFKKYNDYYGHLMGDECLRKIGQVLSENVNHTLELAARYGGEEFACILPEVDLDTALEIAEKIRLQIMDLKIDHKKSTIADVVTASIGLVTINCSYQYTTNDILEKADRLLYEAKNSGRNQTKYQEIF